MTRTLNLIKAMIMLACFPLLLVATLWANIIIIGFAVAGVLWAAGKTWAVAWPVYWADVMPDLLAQKIGVAMPPLTRALIILPAPPESLWATFMPLANMAILAAWPYIIGFAVVWLIFGYFYQERLVHFLTDARGIAHSECPPLYEALENVCARAKAPLPRLYLMHTREPNAYASGLGPSTYSISVTVGLLAMLDHEEVEAVLAHELSHIRHQDVRLFVVAAVMVGMFGWLASMLWSMVVHTLMGVRTRYNISPFLVPFAFLFALTLTVGVFLSALLKMLLLREREMEADKGGAMLTSPSVMHSALATIATQKDPLNIPHALRDMVIYNPNRGRTWLGRWWRGLWSTHPTYERRLAALRAMGAQPRRRGPAMARLV